MSMSRKNILILSRQPPYGGYQAQQCLDLALASAVFEQDVVFVFLEDGVFQLTKGQEPDGIDAKPLGNALETLQLYGIEEVYADENSLSERQLSSADLVIEAQAVSSDSLAQLINGADVVFSL